MGNVLPWPPSTVLGRRTARGPAPLRLHSENSKQWGWPPSVGGRGPWATLQAGEAAGHTQSRAGVGAEGRGVSRRALG